MANLNVAVFGPTGYGKDIGKKGTSTDITFYNLKKGDDTATLIEPTRYPERLAPLFYAASMADLAILVVDKLDNLFGERLLMLDCLGVRKGLIVLRNYIMPDQIAPLLAGTVAEGYEMAEDDPNAIRETLLSKARALELPTPEDAGGAVPIDHHFNVKGVGTVILGSVAKGAIRKHDKLKVLPLKEVATLRSIQKHDDDADSAVEGERVGLALKGIESDRLDRGFVLSTDDSLKVVERVEARARLVKYWPSAMKEDMVVHLGHWMQVVPCRIEKVDNGEDWRAPLLTLALEKELIHSPGDRGVLIYLEGGKLRIAGTIDLP